MIFLYIALFLILLALIYLFVLIRLNKKRDFDPFFLTEYAHRGLHGNGIAENSLEAFKLARDNNFGIELDVQLSKDGEVVVFHDATLKRMTGVDKNVIDLTLKELKELNLINTNQKIPTFKEVLELIDGKIPLLVEIKGDTFDFSVCPKVAEILKEYNGKYLIESFNPFIVKEMKKYLKNALYGQLYYNRCLDKKKYNLVNVTYTGMMLNVISRPDFLAYDKNSRNSIFVKLTTKLYKRPQFVWTPKGQEEIEYAKSLGEYPIFEINKQ
jgi:glycerophosphoryl diester phosphodiesterase